MFYSQFILAKKGPLGTIWIAAHLERKLRKNQVADTDIGVSVDSILFPEVPIALRLSSHLLLGVVRIYSRKVNYLFDDCSEALLKIKQAFRSTAVDLPPEESTAPYHSITLPETFDLDDFELPDNDMIQGNYVDHHISSREQITLQDTMEGVVYSSSLFGLDERFGDGDTSGLDLDEELFLDKVAAAGHAGVMLNSEADPRSSVQPMTPLKQDENHAVMAANSETMLATGNIEGDDGDFDFIEYAQAPSTPGLVDEPNLSNVQEISACDDHLESENQNLTAFAVKENLENASSKSDPYHGDKNVVNWSLLNDMNPDMVLHMAAEVNGYHSGDPEFSQVKPHGQSTPSAVTMERISSDNPDSASLMSSVLADQVRAISSVPDFSDRIAASDGPDRVEDIQNGIVCNDEHVIHSVDETHDDCVEAQGVRLDGSTPDMSSLTNTCQPVSECVSVNNRESHKTEVFINAIISENLEKSCLLSNVLVSNAKSRERTDLEKPETQACQEGKNSEILNHSVHEKLGCTCVHVLQPCIKYLNQPVTLNPGYDNSADPDLPSEVAGLGSLEISGREEAHCTPGASTVVQGEGCHPTDGSEQVLEENRITETASCGDNQAASSKSNDQVDYVISGDSQLENFNSSAVCDLPAPEKLLSVPEGHADVPKILLVEATPDQQVLAGGGAGSTIGSGKKRNFTESAMTVQSLTLVESLGVVRTNRTAESIPDDDDLLSSILVGRKSSVWKVNTTPPEMAAMKRPRSAPRSSASKRKVFMDDTMVLHGDTIRQQLTNTEDIRRVRKKAPCTRPEISMIEKQFWEDDIFSEPICTGVSMELASLHNQTYDLSETRVFQNDASFEAVTDLKLISPFNENVTYLEATSDMDMSIGPIVTKEMVRDNGEVQPVETRVLTDNQQREDHAISSDPDSGIAEPKSYQHEHLGETAEMEIDGKSISDADAVNHATVGVQSTLPTDLVSGDTCDVSVGMVQLASFDKISEADASLQMETPGVPTDQKLDMISVEMDGSMIDMSSDKGVDSIDAAGKKDDDIALVETQSRAMEEFVLEKSEGAAASVEIGTDIQIDFNAHTNSAHPFTTVAPNTGGCSTKVVSVNQAMEIKKNEQGVVNKDAIVDAGMECNAENSVSIGICGEQLLIASSYPAELNVELENVFLDDGGNPGRQEAYPLSMTDAGISSINQDDRDDFDYSAVAHDTEFLNVDDDEVAEADGDCMRSVEETYFLGNSGWSSRTRAVAKYLQTLFDKEAEHGRKFLPIDNLLAGKTRKEASRMFFEALVLKTKDYIHVQQENPFDSIDIMPRVKLLKSDF